MSGPSLKKQDAHDLIHESALNEAKELRMLLQKCVEDGQKEKAIKVAEVSIEHWESRTLQHASSEEEGLYKEMVTEKPHLKTLVIQLTRDHDLMRKMVEQMKALLINNEIDEKLVSLMDSLIIVDSLHNDDEMNKLLGHKEFYKLEIAEESDEIA
ncbi:MULTISPECIES: hemerythrin domain-containing protein [Neobacillus]|uniref:Hemerythrin domain-containing protein n=1 Tax=Neobacillus citreus TaxID=2833578 RepID=A0A942T804_9BACI|nr:hemerythrin domain-containing protein [Neobacillus citreus]MCH6269559.1 hemerythrin domain-containing protein [Neobacillus citreus]